MPEARAGGSVARERYPASRETRLTLTEFGIGPQRGHKPAGMQDSAHAREKEEEEGPGARQRKARGAGGNGGGT